jgi:hypothetical protein
MTTQTQKQQNKAVDENDFSLNTAQMVFMINHENAIERAYTAHDMAFLRHLAASDEYKELFGDMSWDQAYDRYECMSGKCD